MKIALVHDYLSEFGGAERVLKVLTEMYPEAPIYTAFKVSGSTAFKAFQGKEIVESDLAWLLKWKKLYSPLRFLTPWVWSVFNFERFDVVISSASWYITKGVKTTAKTRHICYCHTPPRYLYGYPTAIEWQRYWPVRVYAMIVNHFLRAYDYQAAQGVDQFVVNSENVRERVRKFYVKNAEIIYPPVEVTKIVAKTRNLNEKDDYYLIVSRVVGSKGIDMAMEAARRLKFKLKIVGEQAGLRWEDDKLRKLEALNIEFVGRVDDEQLYELYARAKGFLALALDEDFGMTVVEAMAAGTPVIAYWGGGYKETVIDGRTGVFFQSYGVDGLMKAVEQFEAMTFKRADLVDQARKFSREEFEVEMRKLVGE